MASGWIKIHRKLFDHPRIAEPGWLNVWMYCLIHASHREHDGNYIFKGARIRLKPGQFIASRSKMALVLGVSDSKVERNLKKLIFDQQIEQQSDNRSRLITVLNWESYQESEQQIEHQPNSDRTATEQQPNTHKNERMKECKNGKKRTAEKYSAGSIEHILAVEMFQGILDRIDPNATHPNIQAWARDMDLMLRIDKRTPEQIRYMLKWLNGKTEAAEFWRPNIRCPGKLRKQFTALIAKIKQERRNGKSGPNHSGIIEWAQEQGVFVEDAHNG